MLSTPELIDYFMSEHKKLAPETRRQYRMALNQFSGYCKLNLAEVISKDIRGWISQLDAEGHKPTTLNIKLSALKSFYKIMAEDNLVEKNPTVNIPLPKVEDKIPYYLDKTTLARLFEVANRSKLERVIVETLYYTGVRISELLNISISDINYDLQQIWIRKGKGNKERNVPFTTECGIRLADWINQRNVKSDYVFCKSDGTPYSAGWVRQKFKEYSKILNTPHKMTPHLMRHTFAAHLAEKGMPIAYIQELLGHMDIRTTRIYTRLCTEARKKVYDTYH